MPRGRHFLLWGLCLVVVLLASVFGRPDIPIDETRYVSVAWEMVSRGDWIVLHKNGEPYHHKPPLLFWLIGAGWSVLGVSDWWPRVVNALASLVCLGLTAAIARRLWPGEKGVGERAGWLLLGGMFWLFFSTSVMFDILLCACVLLALLAALRAWQGESRGTWGLFGVALGLGILAKGPVVLLHVLPPLLLVKWWGGRESVERRWWIGIGLGTLLGAAIALTWAIPAAIQGGDEFRRAIFWGQTAGRVTGNLAHKQPVWFYLPILPVLLFPWLLWASGWRAVVEAVRDRTDLGVRFCLVWLFAAFLGFSAAGGKQAHYLLPLMPAFSLLPAFGWRRVAESGRRAVLPLVIALAALGLIVLTAPLWVGKLWFAPYVGESWRIAGVLLIVLALICFALARGEEALSRIACASVAATAILLLGVVRPLWPAFDMTPMGAQIKALERAGLPVAHATLYHDQYHFYGRLTVPLEVIARREVAAWLEKNPQGKVVYYIARRKSLEQLKPAFSQPYLDGWAVLVDAESVHRLPRFKR